MIAPTTIDFSTGKTVTRGTDESVPYKVQGKAKKGTVCDRPNE